MYEIICVGCRESFKTVLAWRSYCNECNAPDRPRLSALMHRLEQEGQQLEAEEQAERSKNASLMRS